MAYHAIFYVLLTGFSLKQGEAEFFQQYKRILRRFTHAKNILLALSFVSRFLTEAAYYFVHSPVSVQKNFDRATHKSACYSVRFGIIHLSTTSELKLKLYF